MSPAVTPLSEWELRLADAVRDVRRASDVDQIPLAIEAGLDVKTVGNIERGQRHARMDQLEAIVAAMARLSPTPTNVQSVTDLLAYADGRISLTKRRDPGRTPPR